MHSLAKGRHPVGATQWIKVKCALIRTHHLLITILLFSNKLDHCRREFPRERSAANTQYDFRPPTSAIIRCDLAQAGDFQT